MKIEIDVNEVLTQEEIKETCINAIESVIVARYRSSESELNRLISNLSYQVVWDMVDRQIDGSLDEKIRSKVTDAIDSLTSFSVFREKDVWGGKESIGQKILNEEIANSRPLIKEKVEKIISNYHFNELKNDEIGDVVYQCIMDRLFGTRD